MRRRSHRGVKEVSFHRLVQCLILLTIPTLWSGCRADGPELGDGPVAFVAARSAFGPWRKITENYATIQSLESSEVLRLAREDGGLDRDPEIEQKIRAGIRQIWVEIERIGIAKDLEDLWGGDFPAVLNGIIADTGPVPAELLLLDDDKLKELEQIATLALRYSKDPDARVQMFAASLLLNRMRLAIACGDVSASVNQSLGRYSAHNHALQHIMRMMLESCGAGEMTTPPSSELLKRLNRTPIATGVHRMLESERAAYRRVGKVERLTAEDHLLLQGCDRYLGWLHAVAASPMHQRRAQLAFGVSLIDESVRDDNTVEIEPEAFDAEEASRVTYDCLRLALALLAIKSETGRWPGSLDDLVPAYLPMLPTDRCSGLPYSYRQLADTPEVVIFYAPGADGEDNGGTTTLLDPDALSSRSQLPGLLDFVVRVQQVDHH